MSMYTEIRLKITWKHQIEYGRLEYLNENESVTHGNVGRVGYARMLSPKILKPQATSLKYAWKDK